MNLPKMLEIRTGGKDMQNRNSNDAEAANRKY